MARPRFLTPILADELDTFPVVVLTGARQTGKSTLCQDDLAGGQRPYLTLDDLGVAAQAVAAPLDLLQRYPAVTLDEVQRRPELLLAVKQLVDQDRPRRPGRFLLTGSANLRLMHAVADSLAGRATYRTLYPMTRQEQLGRGQAGAWGALVAEPVARWPALLADRPPEPEAWTEAARRGGFPVPALELPPTRRAAWFDGYVQSYLERDLRDLSAVQSLSDVRRLMRAAALRVGGLVNQAEIARDVGLPATTVQRYLGLLETSHLLVRLEAYAVNRTKRIIKAPKLYWVDAGLALHLGGGEPGGAHLENLVLTDLLAWAAGQPGARPQVLHWRTASGQEVDFVIELPDGRLIAVEVKATRQPLPHDARHLVAFREEYGEAVHGALLLHGGDETFRLSEGIIAAPWWRVM